MQYSFSYIWAIFICSCLKLSPTSLHSLLKKVGSVVRSNGKEGPIQAYKRKLMAPVVSYLAHAQFP